MTGQGTGTQLPFTCPGPLRPAFHAPPKSLRISHIIAQAALKALPPRAPNTPPHGALRTLAQDLWPSCTSLDPSPRPTRHRPGPPGAPPPPPLWEMPQGLQASRCPPGTLRGTGTGSPADPGKTQAKASTPPKRPSRQGPPAGLLSPHQNLGRQSRRGQGPRCSPATYRHPLRPTPRAGPRGGLKEAAAGLRAQRRSHTPQAAHPTLGLPLPRLSRRAPGPRGPGAAREEASPKAPLPMALRGHRRPACPHLRPRAARTQGSQGNGTLPRRPLWEPRAGPQFAMRRR